MVEVLKELNFIEVYAKQAEAWVKYYNGFQLYLARPINSTKYAACLKVANLEIMLPGKMTQDDLIQFDKYNNS